MNNSYPSYEAEQFWANCANYEESVCIFCLNEELPAREPREQSLCDDDSLATLCCLLYPVSQRSILTFLLITPSSRYQREITVHQAKTDKFVITRNISYQE